MKSWIIFAALVLPFGVNAQNGCDIIEAMCDTGTLSATTSSSSLSDCANVCESNPDCNYFTYFPNEQACLEYLDCYNTTTNCPDTCYSGSSYCLCDIPGMCQGTQNGITFTGSSEECDEACENDASCDYWTYDPTDTLCLFFSTCDTVSTDACAECTSGEKGCFATSGNGTDPTPTDANILLIIGGFNDATGELLSSVETISLDSSLQCPAISDYTESEWGARFKDGEIPGACTGSLNYEDCWHLEKDTLSWSGSGCMTRARHAASSVKFGDDWLVAGGRSNMDGYMSSTDLWHRDAHTWTVGPSDLPYATERHCMANINDTHAILAGGFDGTGKNLAYVFDYPSNTWTELQHMREGRFAHACGTITLPDGTSQFMVAGGFASLNGERLSSVEVLDLSDLSGSTHWERNFDMPEAIAGAAYVVYKNTLLLVGGEDANSDSLDTLYEYDLDNDSWTLRAERMAVARENRPTVQLVSPEDIGC